MIHLWFCFCMEIFLIGFSLLFLVLWFSLGGEVFRNFCELGFVGNGLSILSLWIVFLMVLSGFLFYSFSYYRFSFYYLLLLIFIVLFYSFTFCSYFLFYLRFEFVVIPTFMLILGWGVSIERTQAGFYMFIYTLFSSLPFLLFLLSLWEFYGSLDYTLSFFLLNKFMGGLWWIFVCLVFLVKFPVFFFAYLTSKSSCGGSFGWIYDFSWSFTKIGWIWFI